MTVSELKDYLNQFPDDILVYLDDDDAINGPAVDYIALGLLDFTPNEPKGRE